MARPFIFDIDIVNNSASVSFQDGENHGSHLGLEGKDNLQRVSWFSDSLAVKRK